METVEIITDEQLKDCACILLEKGSMSQSDRQHFFDALKRRVEKLKIKRTIAVLEYMPGSEPPKLLDSRELDELMEQHLEAQ